MQMQSFLVRERITLLIKSFCALAPLRETLNRFEDRLRFVKKLKKCVSSQLISVISRAAHITDRRDLGDRDVASQSHGLFVECSPAQEGLGLSCANHDRRHSTEGDRRVAYRI